VAGAMEQGQKMNITTTHIIPNFRVKCDKHPADYCVVFDGSEVISVFNFVVGACALRG